MLARQPAKAVDAWRFLEMPMFVLLVLVCTHFGDRNVLVNTQITS